MISSFGWLIWGLVPLTERRVGQTGDKIVVDQQQGSSRCRKNRHKALEQHFQSYS